MTPYGMVTTWTLVIGKNERTNEGMKFQYKDVSYQYRDAHVKDKTVSRLSYL